MFETFVGDEIMVIRDEDGTLLLIKSNQALGATGYVCLRTLLDSTLADWEAARTSYIPCYPPGTPLVIRSIP